MAHAEHFLSRLRRVPHYHADFALSLYRDPSLVKTLLLSMEIPPAYDRVALALEDDGRGPYVVLTRDGHFVTCLGRGMRPGGLYVIDRKRVDAVAHWFDQFHGALEEYQSFDQSALTATQSTLMALYQRAEFVSREEFEAVCVIQPLLWGELYRHLSDMQHFLQIRADRLVRLLRRHPNRAATRYEGPLKDYWEQLWAVGHLTLLVGLHGTSPIGAVKPSTIRAHRGLSTWPLGHGTLGMALRVLWAVAQMHEIFYPLHRQAFEEEDETSSDPLDTILCLTAIALKCPAHYEEIAALIRGRASDIDLDALNPEEPLIVEDGFGLFCQLSQEVLDDPTRGMAALVEASDKIFERLEERVPDAVLRDATLSMAPEGMRLALLNWCEADYRVGLEAARLLFRCLPRLAEVEAADLYLPKRICRRLYEWDVEVARDHLMAIEKIYGPPKPVRVDAEPGRNAPCPCGSGEKYKRCCLRKASVTAP